MNDHPHMASARGKPFVLSWLAFCLLAPASMFVNLMKAPAQTPARTPR